jgi:hypothetical protein
MAVSEQTDSLRVLGSDPVDYLITPRTLACMIAGPILNLMCFVMGKKSLQETPALRLGVLHAVEALHSLDSNGHQQSADKRYLAASL